ncbi:MAG: YihY/virulence factor BrkB family protein [Proteobacteria bacterium]|nr:YihY/virulence factor BrkB family protein [Pseudomonadota bacterium]
MTLPSVPANASHPTLLAWADRQNIDAPSWHKPVRLVVRLILITAAEFSNNALSLRSAALTYTVLLSLVPILAMSTALVKGLGGDDQLRKAAYSYIETLTDRSDKHIGSSEIATVPEESPLSENGVKLTDHLRSAVDQLFAYVDKTNFAALGSIGVVGILLSVILVLSYIEDAMNGIWKVASGRSLLRKIADYLTLLILLPISINVAFAASAMLQSPALIAKIDIIIPFPWLQTLLLKAVPVTIITVTFYVMYIFFPNTKVKTLPALFGAGLAAFFWTLVQNIYITLQIGVANYNAIYGSFATLPLFLVWIYLGSLFILTGAQVAYACQNIRTYRLLPLDAVPSLKLGAAFDVMDLIISAFAEAKAITSENLTDYLTHYNPAVIDEVVTKLQGAGLIHVSQTDNRMLPASPDTGADYREVAAIILGTDTADTSGGLRSIQAIKAAAESSSISPKATPVDAPQER